MAVLVRMPEVLAGALEAAIQTWLVEEGAAISVGQPIAEIETDKAVVEFASEHEGRVARLLALEGDNLAVGSPIVAILATGEGDAELAGLLAEAGITETTAEVAAPEPEGPAVSEPEPPAPVVEASKTEAAAAPGPAVFEPKAAAPVAETPKAEEAAATPASAPVADADGRRLFATPLVRKLARERGIDLAGVSGTGPGGRIVRRDLDALPEQVAVPVASEPTAAVAETTVPVAVPAASAPAAPAFGDFEDVPASSMRRTIARRLTESKTTVPHFYMTRRLQIDSLLELRGQINRDRERRVSVNDLVVKAVALAHRAVPDANAIWQDGVIRRFRTVDVGIAVALDAGLITPVLHDVGDLSVGALAERTAEVVERVRGGRIQAGDLDGGTITVSNLGMYGIDEFAAIINPPQSAILAVGAGTAQPVVRDGAVEIATVMSVTLSGDHRVLDGAVAAQWMAAFADLINNPMRLLVD